MAFGNDDSSKIVEVVYEAIDDINQQLPREQRLEKTVSSPLYGRTGSLDSLGLITFIVAVEQKIDEKLGIAITLADERIMAREGNPFDTVGTLVDRISTLLKEKSNGRKKS